MALNRRDILSQLETILATTTGITTVVRSYGEEGIDITQYAEADLPLLEIIEPAEENDEEMTSRRSVQFLDTVLRVYFVDWNDDVQSTYETFVKNVRDKVGANFKVDNKATGCWIVDISRVLGELPLWHIEFDLRVKYYLDQQVT
jgi:hypothetical protein